MSKARTIDWDHTHGKWGVFEVRGYESVLIKWFESHAEAREFLKSETQQ